MGDEDASPSNFKVYQRWKETTDQDSLLLDGVYLSLIQQNYEDPKLDMTSQEDPALDMIIKEQKALYWKVSQGKIKDQDGPSTDGAKEEIGKGPNGP